MALLKKAWNDGEETFGLAARLNGDIVGNILLVLETPQSEFEQARRDKLQ